MKRPSFQFYPGDWIGSQKLRRCSPAARGAWIDLLCVLHDCDEYGVARYPLRELCRAAGVDMKHARELVEKGVLKGSDSEPVRFTWAPSHAGRKGAEVVLVESDGGPCWYCSRFVEDEHKRKVRGQGTRFDSDDNQPKRQPKPSPKAGIGDAEGYGPSSSSSSSVPTDSLSVGTRDARPPEHDVVGYLEGHPEPAPNPLAPFAIALNRAGFRCTAMNPDLVAYAGDGGTVEHLQTIAAMPECKGKPATYVLRFARREITQPAPAIEPRAMTAAGSQHAGGGKTTAAILALEDFAHGRR